MIKKINNTLYYECEKCLMEVVELELTKTIKIEYVIPEKYDVLVGKICGECKND